MIKIMLTTATAVIISGCSAVATVKQYWPRDHDPVMFETLVVVEQEDRKSTRLNSSH